MTGTALQLTAEADARLDDYLRQVRAALAGVPDVSPDDVEADIREHVAAELRNLSNPVTVAELEAVLRALGPPAGWRPAGAPGRTFNLRAWIGEVGRALYRGPEDWRLAYLCLLLVALAPMTFGVSLVAAYLLGRAAAELARDKGEPLGARRWLVYPALVAVSVPLLAAVTLWPVVAAGAFGAHVVVPASLYREHVESVAPDGTVTLRPGVARPDGYFWAAERIGVTQFRKPGGRLWLHINDTDRLRHEWVLRVMDRAPVPGKWAEAPLVLFAGVGLLLAWWLVLGVTRRAFPHTTAAVFFPLLSPAPRGMPWVTAGCAVALAAWLGAARALAG